MIRKSTEALAADAKGKVIPCRIELVTVGKTKQLVFRIIEWRKLGTRNSGAIYVHGSNGNYNVRVVDGDGYSQTLVAIGSLETCLNKAFALAHRYRENGLE